MKTKSAEKKNFYWTITLPLQTESLIFVSIYKTNNEEILNIGIDSEGLNKYLFILYYTPSLKSLPLRIFSFKKKHREKPLRETKECTARIWESYCHLVERKIWGFHQILTDNYSIIELYVTDMSKKTLEFCFS